MEAVFRFVPDEAGGAVDDFGIDFLAPVGRQAMQEFRAAIGEFHQLVGDSEGLEDFEGALFHSARWDHSVPLDRKRIGVIGNGSSGVQITGALAPRAGHFTLFQRTAQWVVPVEQIE